uniref:TNF receptor superfamily member 10c n=1 Tax=Chlorocebus sabaeus TaxID=60711 RepID=A0A0D9RUQ6_CHLSB
RGLWGQSAPVAMARARCDQGPRTASGTRPWRIPKTLKFVVVIVAVLPPVLAYSATTARQEEVSQQTVDPQQQWHSFQEKCPAGSHRSEHTGDCNPCTEGVDYTNASNNLFSLPCTVCKSGQTNKSSCTMTRDPVCHCEEVTFWNRNSPEMCRKYSIGCPSGEVQVSNCTFWSDSQCAEEFGASATVETSAAEETTTASPGTPASFGYLSCIIVGIVVLIVLLIVKKLLPYLKPSLGDGRASSSHLQAQPGVGQSAPQLGDKGENNAHKETLNNRDSQPIQVSEQEIEG